jgi:hypothetical protein
MSSAALDRVSPVEMLAKDLGWRFIPQGQGSSAAEGGGTIVIVAPQWSKKDFEILKRVAKRIPRRFAVELADLDSLIGRSLYHKVLPGESMATQTPVVAQYVAGQLMRLWQGPDEVEDYPSE